MAMVLFPEAQRKAQAEIDRVIGPNRLPTLADREDLPYVDALVKEVYRFNPVAPLGSFSLSLVEKRGLRHLWVQGFLIWLRKMMST